MRHILILSSLFFSIPSLATPSDEQIRERASRFKLQALKPLTGKNANIFKLGERLFFDKNLSGNRNISCASCHHPKFYSADRLMLGLGQGRIETPSGAKQGHADVLKRHSPHVINLGYKDINIMFWDGRVSFDPKTKAYTTPSPGLNGPKPMYKSIAKQLDSILAVQALFPVLSREEMRGHEGENELAEKISDYEVWRRLLKRIHSDPAYQTLLAKAYPGEKVNIGHIGKALGHFQKHFFSSHQTPFDKFMRGHDRAMSPLEKEGLWTFLSKGRCVSCHAGAHLGNQAFRSSGSPQILGSRFPDDPGRGEVVPAQEYLFKTGPLRNIALTAPYFHAGTMANLEEVIEHYNDVGLSLRTYRLDSDKTSSYSEEIRVDTNPERNKKRHAKSKPLNRALGLSPREKEALLKFLQVSLTDQEFKSRMDSYTPPDFPSSSR